MTPIMTVTDVTDLAWRKEEAKVDWDSAEEAGRQCSNAVS